MSTVFRRVTIYRDNLGFPKLGKPGRILLDGSIDIRKDSVLAHVKIDGDPILPTQTPIVLHPGTG